MYIGNVLTILMGVSLFLFGMSLMGEGLKNVAGSKLEGVLWRLSGTPVKGLLTGTAVTTFIQSSSATTIMAVGFVNAGIMQLAQAIAIVLGANIGTSVTGWVLCLSYVGSGESSGWLTLLSASSLAAMIAVVGIAMRMFSKKTANKHIAGILLGFAILMFGMQTMSAAVEPLKNNEGFRSLMTSFSNPFLGILAGIVVTAILQSNSASVGILQALSMAGLIKFSTVFPIVLGMGIGAATPILLSAISANKDGKRAYSSYFEVSAPFSFVKCDWTATVGAVPYATDFYGTTGFAITNISLQASKSFDIKDKVSIPVFAGITTNPCSQKAYLTIGFAIQPKL